MGIDLGTTYSCVGIFKNDEVQIVQDESGCKLTPSQVSFRPDKILIGNAAMNQIGRYPTTTVFNAKRLIGHKFSDPAIKKDIKTLPFQIVKGKDDSILIEMEV